MPARGREGWSGNQSDQSRSLPTSTPPPSAEDAAYEIELSVDETEQPTSLAEHYIIADQCLSRGVKLVSLAPRFVWRLREEVDFRDLDALDRSLEDHAALARTLGPYKLSLHSGSDKLAMYPSLARSTRGLFHVKTAGTSYLRGCRWWLDDEAVPPDHRLRPGPLRSRPRDVSRFGRAR
ncbi:MAG: tagaturonate epimerase family protein [Isosphaeraceae bacterium]